MDILIQLVVAVPMLLSLGYVLKGQTEKAFLNVYLPTLLLAPAYMAIHIPHIPPISIEEGALIPLGTAVILQNWRSWSITRLDFWVLLFMICESVSEALNTSIPTALFVLYTALNSPVLSYVVGKQLVEQKHLREKTVQRLVLMLVIVFLPVLYEYRMGDNPYLLLRRILYPEITSGWMIQFRSGHARTAGPYGHAILAGMIFAAGLVFNTWLRYVRYRRADGDKTLFAKLQRYFIPSMIIFLALLMTRSRGPMLGAAVAILIAQVARFKNVRLAGAVVLGILVVGGIAGYGYAQRYTNVTEAQNEQQGSAVYRRALLDNYAPIVKAGGWFGWGVTEWPKVGGQESIDNQYLFLEVTQGRIGLILFLLIGAESFYALGRAIAHTRNRDDLMFAFSMLGVIVGLFVSLLTVFLGGPVAQLIFLFAGWSSSLKMNQVASERTERSANVPAYAFRRVIT